VGFDGHGHGEEEKPRRHQDRGNDDRQGGSQERKRGVKEQNGPQGQGDDAPNRKEAVAGYFYFGDEEEDSTGSAGFGIVPEIRKAKNRIRQIPP
jgi:hypothetical protein